ncbi:unknown [Odoribacter sp. CAG:788]|nr:unknown [Odoribacter sp. CAG:788]
MTKRKVSAELASSTQRHLAGLGNKEQAHANMTIAQALHTSPIPILN